MIARFAKPALIFFLLILCMSLQCTNTSFAEFDEMQGTWINTNSTSRSIPKVIIHEKHGKKMIRVFGSCFPEYCDWGSTDLHVLGDSILSTKFPYGFATWDKDYAVTHVTLKLENGALSLSVFTIYKDNSNRANFRSDHTFRKEYQ